MSAVRRAVVTLVPVAALGTALAVAVGLAAGMPVGSMPRLASFLAPTVVLAGSLGLVVEPLLRRVTLRVRLVALALLAAAVSAASLSVLDALMLVKLDDAPETAALAVASTVAGVTAALTLARRSGLALDRLATAVLRLGDGDLSVRAGAVGAGPELDRLAGAVDATAARLEQALLAERKNEVARRDLFGAVSHDLRTPLSAVRAMVEAIDDGVVTDAPTLARYVAEIRRSVDVLVELVDDLFDLTQLEGATIAADAGTSSVNEVARAALRAAGTQARAKEVTIRAELGVAASTPCSPRIERVLHNLLQNAIRYAPRGSTVLVEATCRDGRLELSVVDAGEGMAEKDASRVFEPFFRADPSRHGEGAGLGLALVERIVAGLGGEIRLVTAPGEGAHFTVELPVPSEN